MSNVISNVKALGLKVDSADIVPQNPIIFKQHVMRNLADLEEGGKFYQIDVKNNEALEVTPEYVATKAAEDMESMKNTEYVRYVEDFSLIQKLTLVKDTEGDIDSTVAGCAVDLLCKRSGLKVKSADVAVQNEIIFKTTTIDMLSGLVKEGDKYYKLDTKNNTATVVDPKGLSKKAKEDFEKNKLGTDEVFIASAFGLINKLVLEKPKS